MRETPFVSAGHDGGEKKPEAKKMNQFDIDINFPTGAAAVPVNISFFDSSGNAIKDENGNAEALVIQPGELMGIENELGSLTVKVTATGYAPQTVTLNPGSNAITLAAAGSASAAAQTVKNAVKGIWWGWWVIIIVAILILIWKFWLSKKISIKWIPSVPLVPAA